MGEVGFIRQEHSLGDEWVVVHHGAQCPAQLNAMQRVCDHNVRRVPVEVKSTKASGEVRAERRQEKVRTEIEDRERILACERIKVEKGSDG